MACTAPLRRLLDAVNSEDKSPTFVFAGDFVNRGPDSCKVIELLLTMNNIRCARGNHDDIFDLILHGTCFSEKSAGGNAVSAFQWFMDYGLDRTFFSYGLDWQWLRDTANAPTPERMSHLAEVVPKEHKAFIRALPPVLEDETFFVVHGYWPPKEPCYPPLISQSIRSEIHQQLLWARFTLEEIDAEKPWGKRGFFGHTPIHTYFGRCQARQDGAVGWPAGHAAGYSLRDRHLGPIDRILRGRKSVHSNHALWRTGARVNLRAHHFSIALMQPQIAPNTGNIARLCVATGTRLHLVRPFGFILSDKNLRRSAMDYWDRLQLTIHDDETAFFQSVDRAQCWFFTSKADRSFWDANYTDGNCLIFGSETHGLSDRILENDSKRCVRIPQAPEERCLNLSTAAGIGLFEALRR